MAAFINIHALISHPSSMMNRDDSGLQKTAVFGGVTRSRISSQCLKRAIRQSELYKASVGELSIRTNKMDELLALCITQLTEFDAQLIEDVLLNMGSKIKQEKNKETGIVHRYFDAVQPYSIGSIREALHMVKAGVELKSLKKIVHTPTIDVALSGRMDASCPERNIEAAMSVAHSITTHSADIEVDWFTACDDLARQGSGHIGTNEFSSGVFYRYGSIDVGLLAKNIDKPIEETAHIINTIVNCFAQVSPSAKQKTFAAYNKADFVLCTYSNQPLSLANAFRKPIANTGEVMEDSIKNLVSHYENIVNGYEIESEAKAFDITKTARSEQITFVNKISEVYF